MILNPRKAIWYVVLSLLLCEVVIFLHAWLRHVQPIRVIPGIVTAGERFNAAQVDEFMVRNLRATLLPGAAIAIVKDGKILYTAGYGRNSSGEAVSPQTRMLAASLTKSVTAFAAMQLVDAGKVQLETAIHTIVPGLDFSDARANQINLKHLLNQSTGFACRQLSSAMPASLEDVVKTVNVVPLSHEPGEHWEYCNTNYLLLSRVVEVVSGTNFDDYVRTHVFAPLGMKDSGVLLQMRATTPLLERGHSMIYGFALPRLPPDELGAGAGGMVSTADDLARWLAPLSARDREASLLSKQAVDTMWNSLAPGSNYVFGWRRIDAYGRAYLFHNGRMVTYSAHEALLTDTGYGYAILWNALHPIGAEQKSFIDGMNSLLRGREAVSGLPIGTLFDSALAGVMVTCLTCAVIAVLRSRQWAVNRAGQRLRAFASLAGLSCVAIGIAWLPGLANRINGQNLSWGKLFEIWPAAALLACGLGMACAAVVVSRLYRIAMHSRSTQM